MPKPDYDTTLARIAGNIAAGLVMHQEFGPCQDTVERAVELARAVVAEIKRTEPQ